MARQNLEDIEFTGTRQGYYRECLILAIPSRIRMIGPFNIQTWGKEKSAMSDPRSSGEHARAIR
jgi:hypothetical protein